MRDAVGGWLQGFITVTTFTTWTPEFVWDSKHQHSGLARVTNAAAASKNHGGGGGGHAASAASSKKPKPSAGGGGVSGGVGGVGSAGGAADRAIDHDGSLAAALAAERAEGDWRGEGRIHHRVAELALVAGLGCGGWLVRLALEEIAAGDEYDFVVLSSTTGAVSFYEQARAVISFSFLSSSA